MVDQDKVEKEIIEAVFHHNLFILNENLPKFELSIDNFTDIKGNTLLVVAVQLGFGDVVKVLLPHGANPNRKNVST